MIKEYEERNMYTWQETNVDVDHWQETNADHKKWTSFREKSIMICKSNAMKWYGYIKKILTNLLNLQFARDK